MTLTQHLAATALAAAVAGPFCTVPELALFASGSVLIDVDHYILYIQRTGRFDVKGMFRYFDELQPIVHRIPYVGVCAFHMVEFFLLVGVLAMIYPVFSWFLAGCLFHFVLDFLDLIRKKALFIRAYCIVEHLIRRRAPGYPYY